MQAAGLAPPTFVAAGCGFYAAQPALAAGGTHAAAMALAGAMAGPGFSDDLMMIKYD